MERNTNNIKKKRIFINKCGDTGIGINRGYHYTSDIFSHISSTKEGMARYLRNEVYPNDKKVLRMIDEEVINTAIESGRHVEEEWGLSSHTSFDMWYFKVGDELIEIENDKEEDFACFVFGSCAANAFQEMEHDEDFDNLVKNIIDGNGCIARFDKLHDPVKVLEVSSGWDDSIHIAFSTYQMIFALLNHEVKTTESTKTK